jgi:hypothetical protein
MLVTVVGTSIPFVQLRSRPPKLCNSSGWGRGSWGNSSGRWSITVDLSLGAVARDVTSLATSVAGLARSIQGPAIRSSAVTRDVAWKYVNH